MTKYGIFDKCIIAVDNDIIVNITNFTETKTYKRIGSGRNTYICGQKLPPYFNNIIYDSIEILKKANQLYDYSNETSGMYTSYFTNGNICVEYYQINNKKNGVYKQYYPNGKLQEERNYVDDVLHGQFIIYDDKGNKTSEYMYNNGKIHGIFKKWSDGKYHPCTTYEEYMYDNNIKNGPYKLIFSNGNVTVGSYIENNINEFTTITPNNIIIEKRSYDSVQNLYMHEKYYDSSKINEKYMIDGINRKFGEYIGYYENGNIQKICNYNNNIIKKSISYYANGNIESEIIYDDTGNQMNKISYYESGNIKEKYSKINNIGITENYNEDGLLINYSHTQEKHKQFNLEFKSINWYRTENKDLFLEALIQFSEKLQKSIENAKQSK